MLNLSRHFHFNCIMLTGYIPNEKIKKNILKTFSLSVDHCLDLNNLSNEKHHIYLMTVSL